MTIIKWLSSKFRAILSHEIKSALLEYSEQNRLIIRNELERQYLNIRADSLTKKTIESHDSGISDSKLCQHEVIVSLTTYGRRLKEVYLAIESIMQGSVKPNRIILWLEDSLKKEALPIYLQRQVERGLQVEFCADIRSYKKLIPTLIEYPNSIIITIDDDAIYAPDMLERMLESHKKHPKNIIANRVHTVGIDNNGCLISYVKWNKNVIPDAPSFLNFFTGVGGVLYPPKCLDPEVLNESVFMDICRYADDVWFYAMAVKHGTLIERAETNSYRGDPFIIIESPLEIGLSLENANIIVNDVCRNDVQLKAVFEKYGIYKLIKLRV